MTDLSQLTAPTEEPVQLTSRSLGGLKVQKVTERMSYLNILVYGESGVGKTRLAASASLVEAMSPVLMVDIEGGTFSIRELYPQVDVVRVQNWKEMQEVYDELYKMQHGYKTVILDSLTEIQKFSMYNIMKDLIRKEPDRDPDIPSVREWGKNIEQIRLLVRAFRDLPMNAIFTALEVKERNTRTGRTEVKPYLSGKLSSEVAGFLDIVVYYYIKIMQDETKRLLLTGKTEDQVAKDRSGRLPMLVESPSMQAIHDIIFRTEQGAA